MTDNESEVEKIVRSLSFQVLAVPDQSQKVVPSSTSKTTPLNIKIKVRKKHEGALQHGVLSTPIKESDEVPQRIRLVSSDQTIMSFNAIMEDIDLDKSKEQKPNLPNISNHLYTSSLTGSCQSDSALKGEFLLSKVEDDTNIKKDIFGRCKPGGCLDPPFGEDKYSYKPVMQQPNIKSAPEKKKTSSIFSNKWFRKIKKSKTDKNNVKNDEPELNQSVISLYQSGSLQRSIYSNSIITYPSQGSDEKIFDDKSKSLRNSQIRKPSELDNGSLYIIPKKTRASFEKEEAKLKCESGNVQRKKATALHDKEEDEYLITEKQNYGKNLLRTGPTTQESLSDYLADGTLESKQDVTNGAKAGLILAGVAAPTAAIAATALADITPPDNTAVEPKTQKYLDDDLVDGILESKQDVTSGAKAGLISDGVTATTAGIAATVLADKTKKKTPPDGTTIGPKTQEYIPDDLVHGTLESKQDVPSGAKSGLISAGVAATTAGIAATVPADKSKKKTSPNGTAIGYKTQEYLPDDLVDGTLESKQDITSGAKAGLTSASVAATTAGIAATVLADKTPLDDTAAGPKTQKYVSDDLVDGTLESKEDLTSGAKAGLISAGVAVTTAGIAATALADKTKKKTPPDGTAIGPKIQAYIPDDLVHGTLESKPDVTSGAKAGLTSASVATTTAGIAATVLADKTPLDDTAVGPKTQKYVSDDLVDGTLESKQDLTSGAKAGLISAGVAVTTAGIAATALADKTKKKTPPDGTAIGPKTQEYIPDDLVHGTLESKQDVPSGAKSGLISAGVAATTAGIAATVLADKTPPDNTAVEPKTQKYLSDDLVDGTLESKQDVTSGAKAGLISAGVAAKTAGIAATVPADKSKKKTSPNGTAIGYKTQEYLPDDLVDGTLESKQDVTSGAKAGLISAGVAATTAGIAATVLADKTKKKTPPDGTAIGPKTQEYIPDDLVHGTLESKQDVPSGAESGLISAGVAATTAGIAATVLADKTPPDNTAVEPKTQKYLSDDLVNGSLESKQDVTSGAKAGLISDCVTATTAGIAATVLADKTKKKTTSDDTAIRLKTQEYSPDDLVDGTLELKQDVTSGANSDFIPAGVAADTASIAATDLAAKTKEKTTPDGTAVDDLVDGTLDSKQELTSGTKAGLISVDVAAATAGTTATVLTDKTKKGTTPDDTAVGPKTLDNLVDGTLESEQDITGDNATSGAKARLISAGVTAATAGNAATVLTDKTKNKTIPNDIEEVKPFDNDNTDFEVRDKEIIKTISNKSDDGKAAYLNTEPHQHDVTDDKINEKGKSIMRTEPATQQYLSKDLVVSIHKSSQDDPAYYATISRTADLIPTSITAATTGVAGTVLADKTKRKTAPDNTAIVKPSEVDNKDPEVGDRETNNTISNKLNKQRAEYLNTEIKKYEGTDTDNETNYKEKHALRTGPEIKGYLPDDQVDNTASSANKGFIPASVAATTAGIAASLLADSDIKKATSTDDTSGLNSSFTDDKDFKVSDNGINKTIINKSDKNDAEYLNTDQQKYDFTDTDFKTNYKEKSMLRNESEKPNYLPDDQVDSILKSKQDNTGNDFMRRGKAKIDDNDRNKTISNMPYGKGAVHLNTARQQDTLNDDNYKEKNVFTNQDIQEYLSDDLVDSTLAIKQDDTRDNAKSKPKTGLTPSSVGAATTGIATILPANSKTKIKKTSDDYSSGVNLSHDDNYDLMFDKSKTDITDKSLESKQSDTRDFTPGGNESGSMPSGIITATSDVVAKLWPSSLLDTNNIDKTIFSKTLAEQMSDNDNGDLKVYDNDSNERPTIVNDFGEIFNERTKENNTIFKTKYNQLSTNTTDYNYADANQYEDISTEFGEVFSNQDSSKAVQGYVTEESIRDRSKFLTKTEDFDTDTIDENGSFSENVLSRLDTNILDGNKGNQNKSVKDNINDNVSKNDEDILSDLNSQIGSQGMLEKANEFTEVDETHGIDDTKWEYVSDFEHINEKRLKDISENDEVISNDAVKSRISQSTMDRRDISPNKLGSYDDLTKKILKNHQLNAMRDSKNKENLNKKTGHSNIDEIFQNDRIRSSLRKPIKATCGDRHKKGREPAEQFKTKIDLGFHTYTNNDKELIVKSLDSGTLPNRYPNDSVIIAKCDLKDPFYLKVPFGTEQYLLVQIKDNENLTKIIPGTPKSSKISIKAKEQNIRKHQIINEQINSTVKNATRAVKSINKDIVKAHMKDIYGTYKNELVPVQESLTRLKQDINSLILQQKAIRANLLSKRKCGCVKKM